MSVARVRGRLASLVAERREAREALLAALITLVATVVVVLWAPPPGDASAHLYRTWLVERGTVWWDNLWFAGSYPIATYSPLYYFLAAALGTTLVPIFGVVVSSACFAVLVVREWGPAGVWPARLFAVVAVGPLLTGTAPYGLGLAAALAALVCLQRGRLLVGCVLAAVTLAFSALAFFFLGLVLAAVVLTRRCELQTAGIVGAGLGLPAGAWLVSWLIFPTSGRYPFLWWTFLVVAAVGGCMIAVAVRSKEARLLTVFLGLWLGCCAVLFVVPSPVGEIVTRLRYVVLPLALLIVIVAGWRPRWLAVLAIAGAAAYNIAPYVASVAVRVEGDRNADDVAFWQPTIDFLAAHHTPDHLVEVVATGAHWEVYHLPKAGFPVVRGWYRQVDMTRNEVLYDSDTGPTEYREWLHDNAVRFVVLPDVRLDPYTGDRESSLVRDRWTGLEPVLRTADVTIYAVPDPTPLLTGPHAAEVTRLAHDEIRGSVAGPGDYRLRLAWSPHWEVMDGDVTIEEDPSGQISVRAARAGLFRIGVTVDMPVVSAEWLL